MAGIASGSTKLLITGNVAPDLTGESLLEGALKSIFVLFNAGNESFYEAVDAVGVRSAKRVGDFLREIERNDLSLELRWSAPGSQIQTWRGVPDEVARIKYLLSAVKEPEAILSAFTHVPQDRTEAYLCNLRESARRMRDFLA